jgi:hypothetical protein
MEQAIGCNVRADNPGRTADQIRIFVLGNLLMARSDDIHRLDVQVREVMAENTTGPDGRSPASGFANTTFKVEAPSTLSAEWSIECLQGVLEAGGYGYLQLSVRAMNAVVYLLIRFRRTLATDPQPMLPFMLVDVAGFRPGRPFAPDGPELV